MNSLNENTCWFESWFDSPYYHLLYGNRDEVEAGNFIEVLSGFLKAKMGATALDLGCGKGRHAIALHRKGFDVTGIDLAEQSIVEAKQSEQEGIAFFVHDMRHPFMVNYFDFVFNLFTSFGYFSSQRDNSSVISAVKSGLKANGVFVIDFLNAELVKKNVQENNQGSVEAGGIIFHWQKRIENNFVIKDISFEAENKTYCFSEKVQLLTLEDFEKLLSPFFTIENIFGDYKLGKFDEQNSPRLILIARKK